MTTFINQSRGSHEKGAHDAPATHEYVEVWFDEAKVKGFKFHSVGARDVMDRYHRVFGVTVEARHVWEATAAFSCVTNIMGVAPDGHEFFVTWTGNRKGDVEEFHMGDRYGPVVARMTRTGYVQQERVA